MTRSRPGRPPVSRLERARRTALRAKRHLERVQVEFDERLMIDPRSTPDEVLGMMEVKDARLRAALEVVACRRSLRSARQALRDVKGGSLEKAVKEKMEAARAAERKAYEGYRELPDLGFSYASWEALPADARKRGPGKPRDDVDLRLAKAHEDLAAAVERQRAVEKEEGAEHIPLEQLRDPVKEAPVGRPRLDRLGILDRRLKETERRIEKIRAEPARSTRSAAGRPRKSKKVKMAEAQAKARDIRAAIETLEAELDPEGRLHRSLKKLRDERRHLKALERAGARRSKPRLRRLNQLQGEIRALERMR